MYLKRISLRNFRNYSSLKISFNKGINIIYGNNAQGKTNLLESIYVLALTNTFRNVKTGGTLTVPTGSTGYDVWMGSGNYYLGKSSWTKVEE